MGVIDAESPGPGPLRAAAWLLLSMLAIVVALDFCLPGCTPLTPAKLPTADEVALQVFMKVWAAKDLPSLDRCHIADARVVHTTTDDQFSALCGAPDTLIASCGAQVTVGTAGVPEVVDRPNQAATDSTGGPDVHELIHIAMACVFGDGDPDHKDPRMWLAANPTAAGRAASIQGMAKTALGYPSQ